MIRRVVAGILAALWELLGTAFAAAVLGGFAGVIFLPVFLIGGFVFYRFARAWLFDDLEVHHHGRPQHQS